MYGRELGECELLEGRVYRVAQIDLEFERLERRGLALRNFFRDRIDECTVICFS